MVQTYYRPSSVLASKRVRNTDKHSFLYKKELLSFLSNFCHFYYKQILKNKTLLKKYRYVWYNLWKLHNYCPFIFKLKTAGEVTERNCDVRIWTSMHMQILTKDAIFIVSLVNINTIINIIIMFNKVFFTGKSFNSRSPGPDFIRRSQLKSAVISVTFAIRTTHQSDVDLVIRFILLMYLIYLCG